MKLFKSVFFVFAVAMVFLSSCASVKNPTYKDQGGYGNTSITLPDGTSVSIGGGGHKTTSNNGGYGGGYNSPVPHNSYATAGYAAPNNNPLITIGPASMCYKSTRTIMQDPSGELVGWYEVFIPDGNGSATHRIYFCQGYNPETANDFELTRTPVGTIPSTTNGAKVSIAEAIDCKTMGN